MRVGIGYDLHRIKPTSSDSVLWIGGVAISCPFEVVAHSDGDILLHALTDAILGACALGDIGTWFPDSKHENQGRPSSEFVKFAKEKIATRGWRVGQVDSVLILETPKIAPFNERIRQNLASLLDLPIEDVSVKAKTQEGVDAIGNKQAIAAHVVVTLTKG